jgi:phthalate 4,5-cis-dihydrodiol dehydrogenase
MSDAQQRRILGIGIVGIGGAAVNMLPAFARNPDYTIAAAADIDEGVLGRFSRDYPTAATFRSVAELCASPAVDLVYIATPTRLHAEHTGIALAAKKHVLIEKPMAVTLAEADAMIVAAQRNHVLLGVNVKHSFEPRVLKLRALAQSGELGRLRMIHSWRYVDWLYRPRTRAELTPGWGAGLLWRQGPHHFDFLRTIGGGVLRSVRGSCQILDPARRVTGAYTAYLEFVDGRSAPRCAAATTISIRAIMCAASAAICRSPRAASMRAPAAISKPTLPIRIGSRSKPKTSAMAAAAPCPTTAPAYRAAGS